MNSIKREGGEEKKKERKKRKKTLDMFSIMN